MTGTVEHSINEAREGELVKMSVAEHAIKQKMKQVEIDR